MNEIRIEELEDVDELLATLKLYQEAKSYLEEFDWCSKIKNGWYDRGSAVYEKIGVFLFEIEPINKTVDDFIWVIVGDLPSVYLDKSVTTAQKALEIYCELMEEWAENVKNGKSIEECYPITAEPTIENADLLLTRVSFIKKEFLFPKK